MRKKDKDRRAIIPKNQGVAQGHQVARIQWVKRVFILTFVLFIYRFAQIQILERNEYIAQVDQVAKRMRLGRQYHDSPSRGIIRDRNGIALTGIRKTRQLWIDPGECATDADFDKLVALISKYFPERSLTEWRERLTRQVFNEAELTFRPVRFEHIAYDVSDEVWRSLLNEIRSDPSIDGDTRADFLDAVQERIYNRRDYPHGPLAGHILGYTARHNSIDRGFIERGAVGSGLEFIYDDLLTGAFGVRETEWNRKRHIRVRSAPVQHGDDVWTTLDLWLQHRAESHLEYIVEGYEPDRATIIVTEPQTGKVLAMASYPPMDPREFNDVQWGLREESPILVPSIAFQDHFAPGSTFKPLTVAAAIDLGLTHVDEPIDCKNGRWSFLPSGRFPIREAFGHRYGVLTVGEIIQKSSNIGVARLVIERMGREPFYEYLSRFGFGVRSGSRLAGETSGTVIPTRRAQDIDISRMAFGQAMSVTGLQMMMAYGAIANGGEMMAPMIVQKQALQDGTVLQSEPLSLGRVVSEAAAKATVEAMKMVCETGGTATNAQIEEYIVAGKTGTAQILGQGDVKYTASFMGFFPADAPRVCIGIVAMNPKATEFTGGRAVYTGGRVAGDTFREFGREIGRYLRIPEVVEDEESAVAMARGRP